MPARKKTITLQLVYEKLLEHDERFDKIDQRFEQIDQRFDKIELRLTEHDRRFSAHDQRFSAHDQQFLSIDQHFGRVIKHVLDLETWMKNEIARLDRRIDDVFVHLDKLSKDFETLKQEYHLVLGALRRIERQLGDADESAPSIREEIHDVKVRLTIVEAKLNERENVS